MTVRTNVGLKGMRGYFEGDEGPRNVQEFEQDVDQTFRDLREEIAETNTTTAAAVEEVSEAASSNTTNITTINADISGVQGQIDDINSRLSPIVIRGYLTPNTAYAQFAVTSLFVTYAEGAIGSGGGYITVAADGLYQINAVFTAQNSGGSNPRYVIWKIAGEPNGGGFSILARTNGARFSTTTTQEVACSASTVHRFTSGDRIWFRPGATGTTTTAANPDNLVFSVVRVSE